MERMSIFLWANNDAGHVQAVIKKTDYATFQALGFVKSVDEVEPETKPKRSASKNKVVDDAGNANEG